MLEARIQKERNDPALEVRGLRVVFNTYAGVVKALDGIDLTVYKGEVLGLVGESGCGKSVTALAIAGLLPENSKILEGEVILNGKDLLKKSKKEIRIARLKEIALVFQDPMTYLNPVMTIGSQITEIFTGNLKVYQDELVQSRLESIDSGAETEANSDREVEKDRQILNSIRNSGGKLSKK